MRFWDTTPLKKLITEVRTEVSQIEESLKRESLSLDMKAELMTAKARLDMIVFRTILLSEDGMVGHYVDVEGLKYEVNIAMNSYMKIACKAISNPSLKKELYRESERFKSSEPPDKWMKRWLNEPEKEEQKKDEQDKDTRLKVCENGHCYRNNEHRCEWCCSEKVVKRIEKDAPNFNMNLYVRQRAGEWVLTKRRIVWGGSKCIRKITVNIVGGYKFCYHLDGQNPAPYCHYTIYIGGQKITGRELTRKCDQLIDGNLKEISLDIPSNRK